MERLESALAKARKARQHADRETRNGHSNRHDQDAGTTSADWSALEGLTIPPQMAARKRLSALMGAQHSAPYDILRSRVLRQMQKSGWRRLAVTSPNKGCGKTTLSANLALSLARQPELRVILMDFDLRRPSLGSLFHHRDSRSMADLLSGRVDFSEYALRVNDNLAICAGHVPVPHSAELLHSTMTAAVLERIEAKWQPDVMIFDTPPMQGNHDNLGFLEQVDCALIIAAAGSTSLRQIDICEQEIAGLTNVLGTVLNKCRYLDGADGYNYDAYY